MYVNKCNGPALHFRVSIPITQPLRCLLLIEHDGIHKIFYLQYEKLLDFCYACERMNHVMKNCLDQVAHGELRQFGDWLRVQGPSMQPVKKNESRKPRLEGSASTTGDSEEGPDASAFVQAALSLSHIWLWFHIIYWIHKV